MPKHALIVGCNYPGSQYELKGCANDAINQKQLLVEQFGFPPANVQLMLDTDPNTPKPTGAAIKKALAGKVAACKAGDVLVFHFSGHGTQGKDGPNDVSDAEPDGMDEALVPTDFNLIADDDLRDIVAKCPPSVKFTCIFDCCHSGSMLDHPEQAISGAKAKDPKIDVMADAEATRELWGEHGPPGKEHQKHRAIGPKARRAAMAQMLGMDEIKPKQMQAMLVKLYGKDAPKRALHNMAKKKMAKGGGGGQHQGAGAGHAGQHQGAGAGHAGQHQGHGGDGHAGQHQGGQHQGGVKGMLAKAGDKVAEAGHKVTAKVGGKKDPNEDLDDDILDSVTSKMRDLGMNVEEMARDVPKTKPLERGVLVTGCQSHETSADCVPGGNPAKACGAMSNAMQTVVRQLKGGDPNKQIPNKDVVLGIRQMLVKTKMTQNPCLECPETEVDAPFIC